MGKYSINTETEVKLDYVKTRMLVSIANELAEGNRLKELELRSRNNDHLTAKEFKVFLKDLSDQD